MSPDELGMLYEAKRSQWLDAARRYGPRQDAEDAVHDACVAALAGAVPREAETADEMMTRLVLTYANGARIRQMRALERHADWGELPPFEMLVNIEQRVAVQRAVDHLKESHHLDPPQVWAAIQGATVAELIQLGGPRSTQTAWLRIQRTWGYLRERLADWRQGRKHRNGVCGEPHCQTIPNGTDAPHRPLVDDRPGYSFE